VLSRERLTGSQAAFALEARSLRRDSDHSRDPIAGPLETSIALVRARGTPADRTVPLRLETDPADQSVPPLPLETDPADQSVPPLRLETDPADQSVPPLRLETDPAAPG